MTRNGDVVTMPTVVTSHFRVIQYITVNKIRLVSSTVQTAKPYLVLSFAVQVSEILSMDSTKDSNRVFKARFPLHEFTARVHGPSTRPVNSGRELG